jgi:hypothetical protein
MTRSSGCGATVALSFDRIPEHTAVHRSNLEGALRVEAVFTRPRSRVRISGTTACGHLYDEEWSTFSAFEGALQRPGPWIAGIDPPFGQSRQFIETRLAAELA